MIDPVSSAPDDEALDAPAGALAALAALMGQQFATLSAALDAVLPLVTTYLDLRTAFCARIHAAGGAAEIVAARILPGGCAVVPGSLLPLPHMVCSLIAAASDPEPLAIADTRTDPRTAHLALPLAIPLMRSYIGVPIRLHDGTFYGTLCAVDPEPRPVGAPQVQVLTVLAAFLAPYIERERDLAGRARAEAESAAQRDFAQQVMETMGQGLTVTGADGRFEYVNPAYARMVGYPPAALLGKTPGDVTLPEDHAALAQAWAERRAGAATTYEARLVHADGHIVPVLITGAPRRVGDEIAGAIAVVSNLTGRKQIEAARQESEDRYRRLVELAPVAVLVVAGDTILYSNPAGARLLGAATPAEVIGAPALDFVHPDCREAAAARMQRARDANGVAPLEEEQIVRRDGVVLDVETTAAALTYLGRPALQILIQDITARKRAEAAWRESETRFRTFVESLGEGLLITDPDDVVIYANARMAELSGYPVDEIVGVPAYTLFLPAEDWAAMRARNSRRMAGQAEQYSIHMRRRDGSRFWVEINARPLRDAAGTVVGTVGAVTDITQRRKVEEALRRQNDELAALHEMTLGIINRLNLSNLLEAIALRAATLMRTEDCFLALVDPADDAMVCQVGAGLFTGYQGYRMPRGTGITGRIRAGGGPILIDDYATWPDRSPDFERLPLHAMVAVPLQAGGKLAGAISVAQVREGRRFDPESIALLTRLAQLASLALDNARLYTAAQQDIEDRRRAEEALRHSQELLHAVATGAPVVLFALDLAGCITLIEGKALTSLGLGPGALVGRPIGALFPDLLTLDADIPRILAGEPYAAVLTMDGRTFQAQLSPLFDAAGAVTGIVGVATDITSRIRVEAELAAALAAQQTANEQLQILNRAKSDFVSIVSHEFRTPLTVIQGFSAMMRDENFTLLQMKEYATDINMEAIRLSRLITEMLDLDRMESGKMQLNRELIDLHRIVDTVINLIQPTAPHHSLLLDADPALPEFLADHDKLMQVVTNLVNNAIKYSPQGGPIRVTTALEGALVHLRVADQGLGIPAEALETIFDRYARIESRTSRSIQGTGLGLSIVRQIVELHNGRVWAESTLGQGSVFHVTLPFAPSAEA
ncbi:MAG TPA: PAS domain S-box protein [Chloroflexia bacterium]|nr:PAS domain S-box protein [Chloroflexia bacterium]